MTTRGLSAAESDILIKFWIFDFSFCCCLFIVFWESLPRFMAHKSEVWSDTLLLHAPLLLGPATPRFPGQCPNPPLMRLYFTHYTFTFPPSPDPSLFIQMPIFGVRLNPGRARSPHFQYVFPSTSLPLFSPLCGIRGSSYVTAKRGDLERSPSNRIITLPPLNALYPINQKDGGVFVFFENLPIYSYSPFPTLASLPSFLLHYFTVSLPL